MEVEVHPNQNPNEMLNLGANFQPLMPGLEQLNEQVGQEQLLPIGVDQELNAMLDLGDENGPEIGEDFINYVLGENVDDLGLGIDEDEEQ